MTPCHLIQLLLPLTDNAGRPYPDAVLTEVKNALVARFGGVTAYTQAPADGVWAADAGRPRHDRIVIVEVMASVLDAQWWSDFGRRLERDLAQREIVIRAFAIARVATSEKELPGKTFVLPGEMEER